MGDNGLEENDASRGTFELGRVKVQASFYFKLGRVKVRAYFELGLVQIRVSFKLGLVKNKTSGGPDRARGDVWVELGVWVEVDVRTCHGSKDCRSGSFSRCICTT